MIGFNPLVRPGAADFGLLYIGIADGGSGGDPMNLAQNLELRVRQSSSASTRSARTAATANTVSPPRIRL